MEFDLVEDQNKHLIDEYIDDVDFSDLTTTIVHDQLNTISPQGGIQLTNTKTILGQISPTNQKMDLYEDLYFYEGEQFTNGNLDMEFSNMGHLSGNEESINFSASANDENNLNLNELIVTNTDVLSNLQSPTLYNQILNNNPMLSANPTSVIPKCAWIPSDDSNQMQSSQESLLNWMNLYNNNDGQEEIECVGEKRKYDATICDIEKPKRKKLDLINIPATTTINKPDISTPEIVEEALKLGEDYESQSNINSPTSPVINVGWKEQFIIITDVKEEEILLENPLSVQSYSSDFATSSNISTAPPTPSRSINNSTPAPQKRRGRPPKSHSYRPNPEELQHLPEPERKYREQRYKNNEASRQSRLNRKQKEEKDKSELQQLQDENKYLQEMYDTFHTVHSQLREYLRYIRQLSRDDK